MNPVGFGHIRFRSWDHPGVREPSQLTAGERFAERAIAFFGSWTFVIYQTLVVITWMFLNVCGWHYQWDPYPFILLNLAFSTQAAYAAPLVMIAQKRNAQIAGERSAHDHQMLLAVIRHFDIKVD